MSSCTERKRCKKSRRKCRRERCEPCIVKPEHCLPFPCNPCPQPICPPCGPCTPCVPCPQPICGPCGPCTPTGQMPFVQQCDPCNVYSRGRRRCDTSSSRDCSSDSDSCSDSDSDNCSSSSSSSSCRKKRRRCDKCCRSKCCCIKYVRCYRSKCGDLAAILSRTVSPNSYSFPGEIITFSYMITNIGDESIRSPIQICDTKLGNQIINCACILPSMSETFKRQYVITDEDITRGSITTEAIAYIKINECKWLYATSCNGSGCITINYQPIL